MLRFLEELITGKKYRAYTDTLEPTMYPLEQFFESKKVDALKIDFVKGAGNTPIILRPSSMEEAAHVRQRGKVGIDEKRCVYFKDSYTIDGEELARLKLLEKRENDDPLVMRVVKKVYDDQEKLSEGARATAEYMRSQLMCSGNIVVDDAGVTKTLDYNLKAEQKFTVSKSWDDPTALILDDLEVNIQEARSRGEIVDVAMCDSVVLGYMKKNDQIIKIAKNAAGNDIFMTSGVVERVIEDHLKVKLLVNDRVFKKADDTTEKFWDSTKLTLFSNTNKPGYTNYGISMNELMLGIDGKDVISMDNDSFFLYIKWEDDPVSKQTIVDMNCVPSLEGGNALQIMTVKK